MGLVGALVGLSIARAFIRKATSNTEPSNADDTASRRYTTCRFDNGVTEQEFNQIVAEVTPRLPRYISHERDGAIVRVTFKSNSGLTQWSARVGFAEYGTLTSDYWVKSSNSDSILPNVLGERIADRLKPLLEQAKDTNPAEDADETSDTQVKSSQHDWIPILCFFALALIICISLAGHSYVESTIHRNQSKIPLSSQSMIGMNYADVEKRLTDAGFTSVQTIAKGDLPWFLPINFDNDKIAEVQVDGAESFEAGDWLNSNTSIVLYYHSRQT